MLQPGGTQCAIDDTVVAGKRDVHDVGDAETAFLALIRDNLLGGAANSEDACLWRVDDGGEGLGAKHAEIGDGEGATII
ncbi:hypothetical protein BC938DRAFT_475479 [Jimgerdemannia flammicorona]|uniref:Uncharacterized protein n=1 Tax=Jimgerdemannia flammicorona TaxID=994334 RepID=A0A433PTV7_9FUNG|nr:hypothetical protein BC938DRAFT_475479 [Jimgerdemannia flammicorona]